MSKFKFKGVIMKKIFKKLILKIKEYLFFRKIRKIDFKNDIKYCSFRESCPRSTFFISYCSAIDKEFK